MDNIHGMKSPEEIITLMMNKDAFSNWMNIRVNSISKGSCSLVCKVKEDMLNGFSIAHGGITYSLADSTLAFAANSYGFHSFSIETSISHLVKVKKNDTLTSVSKEIHRGKKTGLYHIEIYNQNNELVALMKGTVYISKIVW